MYIHQYTYLCPLDSPVSSTTLHSYKEHRCPCVAHHTSGPTTCIEFVHASVHEFMSLFPCLPHSLWILSWKHGCPFVALCVCYSHPISCHVPLLECVHASVHVFSSIWLPIQFDPLCIVTWKHGCPCVAQCMCSSHPTFGPTPWLECIHASEHVLMSTWLPMSASPH